MPLILSEKDVIRMNNRTSMSTRWILTIAAVIINAFGVAIITTAGLGTVPATAIPNVLSIVYPRFTLGTYLFVLSILQIFLQIILLRKEFRLFQLTQIIPAVVLSYFVDFFMMVLRHISLSRYGSRLVFLVLGAIVLAFSIALEVHVDLIYLPLDGLVQAISKRSEKRFDQIKTLTDCLMVGIAILIIVPIKHGLYGVREGTIIAALCVGWFVNRFTRLLNRKHV